MNSLCLSVTEFAKSLIRTW